MIQITYTPISEEDTYLFDTPDIQELTMTLNDGVTWYEAEFQFRNFLRGAGYVIPYNLDDDEDE